MRSSLLAVLGLSMVACASEVIIEPKKNGSADGNLDPSVGGGGSDDGTATAVGSENPTDPDTGTGQSADPGPSVCASETGQACRDCCVENLPDQTHKFVDYIAVHCACGDACSAVCTGTCEDWDIWSDACWECTVDTTDPAVADCQDTAHIECAADAACAPLLECAMACPESA